MNHETTALAFLVRTPVLGQVKTRLAVDLGTRIALDLYQAMVEDILTQIRHYPADLHLFYSGKKEALPHAWHQSATAIHAQATGDIGVKMYQTFRTCFAKGYKHVLLFGSDLPELDSQLLNHAHSALAAYEVVFAPTFDGGYGLIGLGCNHCHPALFTNIAWSTEKVLAQSLMHCRKAQLQVFLLNYIQDIDTIENLRVLYRRNTVQAKQVQHILHKLLRTGLL